MPRQPKDYPMPSASTRIHPQASSVGAAAHRRRHGAVVQEHRDHRVLADHTRAPAAATACGRKVDRQGVAIGAQEVRVAQSLLGSQVDVADLDREVAGPFEGFVAEHGLMAHPQTHRLRQRAGHGRSPRRYSAPISHWRRSTPAGARLRQVSRQVCIDALSAIAVPGSIGTAGGIAAASRRAGAADHHRQRDQGHRESVHDNFLLPSSAPGRRPSGVLSRGPRRLSRRAVSGTPAPRARAARGT